MKEAVIAILVYAHPQPHWASMDKIPSLACWDCLPLDALGGNAESVCAELLFWNETSL